MHLSEQLPLLSESCTYLDPGDVINQAKDLFDTPCGPKLEPIRKVVHRIFSLNYSTSKMTDKIR